MKQKPYHPKPEGPAPAGRFWNCRRGAWQRSTGEFLKVSRGKIHLDNEFKAKNDLADMWMRARSRKETDLDFETWLADLKAEFESEERGGEPSRE